LSAPIDALDTEDNLKMIELKSKYWYALLVPIVPTALLMISVNSDIGEFRNRAPFSPTTGRVSKLDCSNHGNYYVAYEVNGTPYTEMAGNLYLKGNCGELKVNDSVAVWASQKDSKYVSFISPESALEYMTSESRVLILAYPFFALFILGATTFNERKKPSATGRIEG
jgi:hypothetical protein